MTDLNMPFVPHATDVEYLRCMRKISRADISLESDVYDLSCCCLLRPFSSFYMIGNVKVQGRDLDSEVRQRLKGFLIVWHNRVVCVTARKARTSVYSNTGVLT